MTQNHKKKLSRKSTDYRVVGPIAVITALFLFLYTLFVSPHISNKWFNILIQTGIIVLVVFLVDYFFQWYDKKK